MTAHGGRNDCIQLDTGHWACRWIWLERQPWDDPVETVMMVGCTHDTELEARQHIDQAARAREIMNRI